MDRNVGIGFSVAPAASSTSVKNTLESGATWSGFSWRTQKPHVALLRRRTGRNVALQHAQTVDAGRLSPHPGLFCSAVQRDNTEKAPDDSRVLKIRQI